MLLGSGNHALSAEILEQVWKISFKSTCALSKHVTVLHNYPLVLEVFLYLSHDDLMTLLMVCKFWAAVAERPQLWTEFRLLVSKYLADCLLLVWSQTGDQQVQFVWKDHLAPARLTQVKWDAINLDLFEPTDFLSSTPSLWKLLLLQWVKRSYSIPDLLNFTAVMWEGQGKWPKTNT